MNSNSKSQQKAAVPRANEVHVPQFLRITVSLSLLGVFAWGAYFLLSGEEDAGGEQPSVSVAGAEGPVRIDTPEGCCSCHPREYAEWKRSRHALAWTNPQLEAYADLSLGLDDCVKCHAPRPVLLSGLGTLPEKRGTARETGVDCLTCHLSGKGIVGVEGNSEAPCRPAGDPRLRSSAVCSGCHRTIGLDWGESAAALDGKQCIDCHMPGTGERGARTHDMRGGHDPRQVRKAFALDVDVSGREAVVRISNRGAGHNFPGERHFRILMLIVDVLDAEGRGVDEFRRMIKNVSPIRRARLDAKIRSGRTEEYVFPLPAGPGAVRARLLYKLYPSVLDHEALVAGEVRVAFR